MIEERKDQQKNKIRRKKICREGGSRKRRRNDKFRSRMTATSKIKIKERITKNLQTRDRNEQKKNDNGRRRIIKKQY